MDAYKDKPKRYLTNLGQDFAINPATSSYCAGFEIQKWRCESFADHLIEWIADYALREDELHVNHGNMYIRLKEAAARIYNTDKYKSRGELGELALHAICRDFFETVPIAPRVFYLTSSNDVVKSFDMAHVRYIEPEGIELWLGESKLYRDSSTAINAAIDSIRAHIDQGFLNNEKLILGPQISKNLPLYDDIREVFSVQSSLDKLFSTAVFPVCIMADSLAVASATCHSDEYLLSVQKEISQLKNKIVDSGLNQKIRIILIYVPLLSKDDIASAFHLKLKGLSV
ncbi:HamA C-terminal domain-containing protein [Pseudoxanthomonas winnipegensis]|uniref:HamA C-terminal domain-containing protein n=1 Tax=Pseudoxanthomonas winnipegensis TaxID=2480810 RepID=UPI0013F17AC0|nr:DUF1837 domain-containing protein [Pseudoxanthomonas winnipegensis]